MCMVVLFSVYNRLSPLFVNYHIFHDNMDSSAGSTFVRAFERRKISRVANILFTIL